MLATVTTSYCFGGIGDALGLELIQGVADELLQNVLGGGAQREAVLPRRQVALEVLGLGRDAELRGRIAERLQVGNRNPGALGNRLQGFADPQPGAERKVHDLALVLVEQDGHGIGVLHFLAHRERAGVQGTAGSGELLEERVRVRHDLLRLQLGGHGPRPGAGFDRDGDVAGSRAGVVGHGVPAQEGLEELRADRDCDDEDRQGQHQGQEAAPAADLLGRNLVVADRSGHQLVAGFAVVLGVRVCLGPGVAGVVVNMVGLVVGVHGIAVVGAGVMGDRIVAGLVALLACRRIDGVLVASVFADGHIADRHVADGDHLREVIADGLCVSGNVVYGLFVHSLRVHGLFMHGFF